MLLRRLLNLLYGIRHSFLRTLVFFLRESGIPLPIYRQKRCFAGFFTAFAVLFWALWWLFCVILIYRCQYTCENVISSALKTILRHSSFFFIHFGGFFMSFEHTVTNICCFTGFETGFKAFLLFFWALWWLICFNLTYRCQDMGENVSSPILKLILSHLLFFFEIFWWLFLKIWSSLSRYRRKLCISGFVTGFTAFSINLGALWWFFLR